MCNNLMVQLKHQIRNIIYVLAFDLFRNQVKRELVVEGKRTGKTEAICCFSNSAVAGPYGHWRQGGAGSCSELTAATEPSTWENTAGCHKD